MKKKQLNTTEKTLIEVVKRYGVKKAALFGSIARGEATQESDIEI